MVCLILIQNKTSELLNRYSFSGLPLCQLEHDSSSTHVSTVFDRNNSLSYSILPFSSRSLIENEHPWTSKNETLFWAASSTGGEHPALRRVHPSFSESSCFGNRANRAN